MGYKCGVYLSVHWMLTEAIVEIYVPQGRGILNEEVIP